MIFSVVQTRMVVGCAPVGKPGTFLFNNHYISSSLTISTWISKQE